MKGAKPDRSKPFPNLERTGTCRDTRGACLMSTRVVGRLNCSRCFARRRARRVPKGYSQLPMPSCIAFIKGELTQILKPILRREEEMGRLSESERPVGARRRTWLWPHESDEGLPPLRILLVWDNLAGHLSHDLFPWLFHHGIMPLYTRMARLVAEYGRVDAAHHCTACSLGPAPTAGTRADRRAGTNRGWLECRSHPFCLGRQTPPAARTGATAPTRWIGGRSPEGLLNCGVTH